MERRHGGAGVIVRLQRVRPAQRGGFQPLRAREITPAFLNRLLKKLRRWNFDILSLDEVCQAASQPLSSRRFVCLTFDGGTRDFIAHAYPVLSRHDVPFTVYVPTAFPDGLGQAWWLALEQIVARHDRIDLIMDGAERRFHVSDHADKYDLYALLESWLLTLPPSELAVALGDLGKRYSVDLAALSREAAMDWNDLTRLAGDQRATIATATVNYPVLANMKDAAALREMTMGRAVAKAALGRDARHLAYPFGGSGSFDRQHVVMAANAGFTSAVSSRPGVVLADGQSDLHALPRIDWDGRRSLRAMRVMLSGVCLQD